jgi:hypothetical protein
MAPASGRNQIMISPSTRQLIVLLAAAIIAIGFTAIAYSVVLNETLSKNVQEAIKLAAAAIGFGVSVYAGVKALVELAAPGGEISLARVQAISLAGASSALLFLASQL